MSHDFRTPLNGILGYAQLMRSEPLPAEALLRLDAIERCGDHLLKLVGDLLDLARIEAGRVELDTTCVPLQGFVGEIADVARMHAGEKGLGFHTEVHGDLSRQVELDARKLRQVLLNLLDNAVKFTEEGQVCLRIAATPARSGWLFLNFDISDTGPGISTDDVKQLFDPFYRANRHESDSAGAGLGLAVSQELIHRHHGIIKLSSEHPTVFSIYLPMKTGPLDE